MEDNWQEWEYWKDETNVNKPRYFVLIREDSICPETRPVIALCKYENEAKRIVADHNAAQKLKALVEAADTINWTKICLNCDIAFEGCHKTCGIVKIKSALDAAKEA
jgi:hypothetical protein